MGAQYRGGDSDAALDGCVATVRPHHLDKSGQPPAMCGRQPDEPRPEMGSIVAKIPVEKGRCKKRYDGHWLAKMREFLPNAQKGLGGGVAEHRQIGALDAEEAPDDRRYTLVPAQPVPGHDRFAGKQDSRTLRVDLFSRSAYSVAGGVERIFYVPSIDPDSGAMRWREDPAKTLIGRAQRLRLGARLVDAVTKGAAQYQLAAAERQQNRQQYARRRGGKRKRRQSCREAPEPRPWPRGKDECRSQHGQDSAHAKFTQGVKGTG